MKPSTAVTSIFATTKILSLFSPNFLLFENYSWNYFLKTPFSLITQLSCFVSDNTHKEEISAALRLLRYMKLSLRASSPIWSACM